MDSLNRLDLSPLLRVGLPPNRFDRSKRNFLTELTNLAVRDFGLRRPDEIVDIAPLGKLGSIELPHPMFFRGEKLALACYKDGIAYTEKGAFWQEDASGIDFYAPEAFLATGWDPAAPGEPGAPTPETITESDEPWHFSDQEDGWAITNGTDLLFRLPTVGHFLAGYHIPNTVCSYRGRMFSGGYSDTLQYSDDYKDAMFALHEDLFPDVTTKDFSINTVVWSSFGFEDAFLPHFPWQATDKWITALIRRREFGFATMPWSGIIQKVLPLRSGVMVYGSNGISFLRPAVGAMAMQRFDLLPVGIPHRSWAGGDNDKHIFIDQQNCIWQVEDGNVPKLTKLGYEAEWKGVAGKPKDYISIYRDAMHDDFYISDDETSYILTNKGLCQWYRLVGGMIRDEQLRGYLGTHGTIYSSFETGELQFEDSGRKTIYGLEGLFDNPVDFSAKLYYKMGVNDSWLESDWIAFDKTGYCELPAVSALLVKIGIRSLITDSTELERQIEEIRLVYDKRGKLSLKELIS